MSEVVFLKNLQEIENLISFGNMSGYYNCGDGASMLLVTGVSENNFSDFLSDVRKCGYPEVQSSCIDNLFSHTFSCDKGLLIVVFDKAGNELRIISDNYSAVLNVDYAIAGKCPVRFWQFEIDHSLIDCGMCYIVQLSDYSFFIVDSAHTYSVNDDRRIFDFLRQETPPQLPVRVTGWFLSHGHVDHIAKFLDILMYNNEITIDGIYYNFVPNDHFSSDSWMQSDKNHTEIFFNEMKKHPEIQMYKLHSGQYFYLDCVRFDVLCTHEDVYPASLENYNDSSTVIMMTVNGDKVCFPGDGGGEVSRIVERRYPDFLRCDIIQVAHHGHFGTTSDFYRLTDSKVALFATTKIKFDEEFEHYEANKTACSIAEYVFIASDGTVGFSFPLKNSDIDIYKDETFESFEGIYNLWGYEYSDEKKAELYNRFKSSINKKIKY